MVRMPRNDSKGVKQIIENGVPKLVLLKKGKKMFENKTKSKETSNIPLCDINENFEKGMLLEFVPRRARNFATLDSKRPQTSISL